MTIHYDTIIIGAGPGGLAAAYALNPKQTILIIENDLWGGTCPNRGCDPKKMLYSAVETQDRQQALQGLGLTGISQINWPELMAFKNDYTQAIPGRTLQGLQQANIDTIHGTAHFIDNHHLQVATDTYSADHFIIATGQSPIIPALPGHEHLQTSTDFLSLPALPAKIALIGAGYVALELANIAATAGAEVHIIQHNHRILRAFPEGLTQQLVTALTQKGVQFHFDTQLTRIEKDHAQIRLIDAQQTWSLTVDAAFAALGRQPNTADLALTQAGVQTTHQGIVVNDHLQTANPRIFAIGDVVDRPQPKLTPVVGFEGRYVAQQLLGQDRTPIDYPLIPEIVYASPQIAQVGLSLATAQAEPEHYRIQQQDTTHWYTFNRIKEPHATVITILDQATDELVGAAVYSSLAEQLINYLTFLIQHRTTATQLKQQIFAYPSPASDLNYYL